MNASNHGRKAAIKAACISVAILAAVVLTVDGVGYLAGARAGVAVIAAAFAACWLIFRDRPVRHPAPDRRVAPGRDPQTDMPLALSESKEPARLAA